MKYSFELYARPLSSLSSDDKHAELVAGLCGLDNEWGLPSGSYPSPNVGGNIKVDFPLGKHLGKGIKGSVWYRYRGDLSNTSADDDYINLDFNPSKVDYDSLIELVFPEYIRSFKPYWASIGDEEFIYIDSKRSLNVDRRKKIVRFFPVTYLDEELCKNVYGFGLDKFIDRISNLIEYFKFMEDGVLIIVRSVPVSIEDAEGFNEKFTQALSPEL